MINTCENDCEDQAVTLLSDGCQTCVERFDESGKSIHPAFIKMKKRDVTYWTCPLCKGNFGEVLK